MLHLGQLVSKAASCPNVCDPVAKLISQGADIPQPNGLGLAVVFIGWVGYGGKPRGVL